MSKRFLQDYEIRIKFDIHGEPYWGLFHKGMQYQANVEETSWVMNTLEKFVKRIKGAIDPSWVLDEPKISIDDYKRKYVELTMQMVGEYGYAQDVTIDLVTTDLAGEKYPVRYDVDITF